MNKSFLLSCLLLTLLISSCSSKKNVFEVEKETLDPTFTTKRNSLALPPNYSLNMPSSSQERNISNTYDSLYTFLLDPTSVNLKRIHKEKEQNNGLAKLSANEKKLLELVESNSSPINADIKDIVNQDAYNQVRKSKSFMAKVFLLDIDLEKDNSIDDKFNKYININKIIENAEIKVKEH